MATERQIVEALDKIASEVSGFIGASLVDLDSGMTLAMRTSRSDFDLAAASAYNSEMVKQNLRTLKALNINSKVEDVFVTLADQIHFVKMVTPETFVYLAAERASTNLAIIRNSVARRIADFG